VCVWRSGRFDNGALEEFVDWREPLERLIPSHTLSPAFEGHIAKYRKLVPALALVNHRADNGSGRVGCTAPGKAIATGAGVVTQRSPILDKKTFLLGQGYWG